ncbi:pyrroline-5-carboxylate reductase [Dokdonella sp.]|uniref:pyrroline-5-carboxylate reductase n=1 Tax=Dokdonella sp. TaxID=2291710 RepID=UPI0031C973F6|nr:pyrroline-5-carboxylate reductase [Dokdonella sp.]
MVSSTETRQPRGDERLAFIGGGNMARSLVAAALRGGCAAASISVAEPNATTREALVRDFAITAHATAREAAQGAGTLLLAIKPQIMKGVCAEIAPVVVAAQPLVISIAAGIRLDQLASWLGADLPIVRVMPNTPALIGAGASGLIANARVTPAQRERAAGLLGAAGSIVWIEREALMDTVTALSGSGPAYFFLLVEALEEAAVAQGLPRDIARALATQTCLGAGRMLTEEGEPPAELRQRVTSPGGTTAAALDVFIHGGLRELVANAVTAATRRGAQLSEQFS